jgi:hypothetical protein
MEAKPEMPFGGQSLNRWRYGWMLYMVGSWFMMAVSGFSMCNSGFGKREHTSSSHGMSVASHYTGG